MSYMTSAPKTVIPSKDKQPIVRKFNRHAQFEDGTKPVFSVTSTRNNDITVFIFNTQTENLECLTVPDYKCNEECLQKKHDRPFTIPYYEQPMNFVLDFAQLTVTNRPAKAAYDVQFAWLEEQFKLVFPKRADGTNNTSVRPQLWAPRRLFFDTSHDAYVHLQHVNIMLPSKSETRIDIDEVHLHGFDMTQTHPQTGQYKVVGCRIPRSVIPKEVVDRAIQRMLEFK